jgi:hypothetical protein
MAGLSNIQRALLDTARRLYGNALADRVEAESEAHPDRTWEDLAQESGVAWEYIAQDEWLDDECEIVSKEPCPDCSAHNGEEYETWGEAMKALPDGGPNPKCTAANCYCRIAPRSSR